MCDSKYRYGLRAQHALVAVGRSVTSDNGEKTVHAQKEIWILRALT